METVDNLCPIHVAITRRVRAGCETDFQTALREFFRTSGCEHVAALSQVGTTARTAIDTVAKAEDAATADLFTEGSRGVEKLLWLVEAHMQAKE